MIAPSSLAGSCRRGGPTRTRSQPRRLLASGRAASRTRAVPAYQGISGGWDWARRARPTPQPATAWQRHCASVVADPAGPRGPEPARFRRPRCCSMTSNCLSKNYHGRASRDATDGPAGPGWASTDQATRRAAGPRYAPGHWTALRVWPAGRATKAGRTTNHCGGDCAIVPLDLRTSGRTMCEL
jgi:hypothetical protein